MLREAYRVLAPGRRFAVSDIDFQGHLPQALRHDLESRVGCIAGALEEETYRDLLQAARFVDIEVEAPRRYALQDIAARWSERFAHRTWRDRTALCGWQIRERLHPRQQNRTVLVTRPFERPNGFSSYIDV